MCSPACPLCVLPPTAPPYTSPPHPPTSYVPHILLSPPSFSHFNFSPAASSHVLLSSATSCHALTTFLPIYSCVFLFASTLSGGGNRLSYIHYSSRTTSSVSSIPLPKCTHLFTSLPTSFPRRPESSYLIPLAPRLLHLPPPPLHQLPPPTSSSSVSLFLFAFPKCCSPAAGVGDLTVRAPLRARLLPRTDLARLGHTRTACASFCSRSLHRVRLEPVVPSLRFLPGFPGGVLFFRAG